MSCTFFWLLFHINLLCLAQERAPLFVLGMYVDQDGTVLPEEEIRSPTSPETSCSDLKEVVLEPPVAVGQVEVAQPEPPVEREDSAPVVSSLSRPRKQRKPNRQQIQLAQLGSEAQVVPVLLPSGRFVKLVLRQGSQVGDLVLDAGCTLLYT